MADVRAAAQEDCHRRTTLFESADIAVVEFRCHAHGEREGPEEPNPTNSIAFVRRGVFRRAHQGRTIVADASRVLFFNAAHGYQYSHPVRGGDDCTILTVSTQAAVELVGRYAPRDAENPAAPFRVGHGFTTARLARLHYELLSIIRRGNTRLAVEDALADVADEALRAAYRSRALTDEAGSGAAHRRRELVEAAKVLINRRLHSVPSLQTLAATLDCSPFHLSRTFHQIEGTTLRRYLGRLRARIAADSLARGASDLTDLALRLGYADHSHFTNAFRREWGCPPSQFRVRYRRIS